MVIKLSGMKILCKGAIASLRDDGIVEIDIHDNHICTVEDARNIGRVIKSLGKGNPMPVLRIAGRHASVETGVREFVASPVSQKLILADAIVIHSLSQRLIGNFYMKMNKPVKPTRLFTDVREAEVWLRTFIPCLN